MLVQFFTNPIEGYIFGRFRYIIMGYLHINNILLDSPYILKEIVEIYKIVTGKYEEKNGKKLYTEIVKRNRQKWNKDKYGMKSKEEERYATSTDKVQKG